MGNRYLRGNVVSIYSTSSVLIDEITPEGEHLRRVKELKLDRDRTPFFTLSGVVLHEIDENPSQAPIVLLVTLNGHDRTYGQTIYSRHTYESTDIRSNHKFEMSSASSPMDGWLMIDYARFHDTEPI